MKSGKIIRSSIIYLGSSILNKAIPFLLLPIMTYHLTPEEYGVLAIFMMIVTLYNALIGINIHVNISRNFFRYSKQILSNYIGNMIVILVLNLMIYLAITLILSNWYESIFSVPIHWVCLVPFIAFFMMINNMNTTILRNEGKALIFGVFEVALTVVNMSVTIFCLLILSYGWQSQAIGILSSSCMFFILGIFYMRKHGFLNFKFDLLKIKSILNVSLPMIPHVIGSSIIALSDRLFIEKMINIESVGIYSVGYMFGMIVMLFSDAFIKAWSPWFYKTLVIPSEENKTRIVKYTYLYILGLFILTVFISVVGIFILPYFVSDKFLGAAEYIFWISMGYALFGVYQIFYPYLVHINRTSFLAFSTVTAAIVNLILNYYFINSFGTIGAAYATIAAFTVSSLMVILYTQRKFKMPWFNRKHY